MARRIQRKRTKGWRMPEGVVYVGRGTQWGNPFKVNSAISGPLRLTREEAVEIAAKRLAQGVLSFSDVVVGHASGGCQ
jgi:hypothetical protein